MSTDASSLVGAGRAVARKGLDRLGLEVRRTRPRRARGRRPGARVLVACVPKSGSTYLSTILERLPGMARVQLVPDYGRREQELDGAALEACSRTSWVAQHHVRHSAHTQRLLDVHRVTPVVLVRDLADACVSFRDHLRRESVVGPVAFVTDDMPSWDDERLIEFIIDMAAPWYVAFHVSWQAAGPGPLHATYEQLVADPHGVVRRVVDHAGIAASDDDVARAVAAADGESTRRNVAVVGRGHTELTDAARSRLATYASYYPGFDLSSLGL